MKIPGKLGFEIGKEAGTYEIGNIGQVVPAIQLVPKQQQKAELELELE